MEANVPGATQTRGEKREGETRSPDSWPDIRDGKPEGAAENLRDVQPEKRRGNSAAFIGLPAGVVLIG